MAPRNPSLATSLSHLDQEQKRARIREEGKKWAANVNKSNAWDKLVLTLDGGGIRGYSSLLILEALMHRVAYWEWELNNHKVDIDALLPCHYFDYMWGTSTGGLIAIMLGRLRMSVTQALSVYRDVGNTIFGKKQRRTLGGLNFVATRFNHINVERAVKKITRQYCREHEPGTCTASDTLQWTDMSNLGIDNSQDLCQAVCITARARGKHTQALPLRSYHYEHHPSLPSRDPNFGVEDLDLLIWEAARATSAAPFYFKMYEKRDRNGRLRRYKDGGTLLNNPAQKALNEVRDRYGINDEGLRREPALLLSVGTGIRYDTPFADIENMTKYAQSKKADIPFVQSIKERLALAKHILVRYTEGELVHRTIRANLGAEHSWYKRLNVDSGLGNMDLADWRKGTWIDPSGIQQEHSGGATLSDIEAATRAYLARNSLHTDDEIEWYLLPSEILDHTAERLVRHRIERRKLVTPQNEVHWQTYQGRYVSGRRADPWNNDSHDDPITPSVGSVKHLKQNSSRSTT